MRYVARDRAVGNGGGVGGWRAGVNGGDVGVRGRCVGRRVWRGARTPTDGHGTDMDGMDGGRWNRCAMDDAGEADDGRSGGRLGTLMRRRGISDT